MFFFDSHAHISSDALFPESSSLIEEAKKCGVLKIINIATDQATLQRGFELEKSHPGLIYNTAAITPHDVNTLLEDDFNVFKESAKNGKLKAIGETGLDYHYTELPKDKQKKLFIEHLHLALECNLPVVIHCREAFKDLFEILDAEYVKQTNALPGVIHCFTGTIDEAKSALNRNWYVSFSGIVTFNKSHALQDAARTVPLEKMLIETDAPYLSPMPLRGKRNEPAHVIHTAKFIAGLHNVSLEAVAKKTWENGHSAFKIQN